MSYSYFAGHTSAFIREAETILTRGGTVVLNTPYTIVDREGLPLCHTMTGTRKNAAPARKNIVKNAFDAMMRHAGSVSKDGNWRTISGQYLPPAGMLAERGVSYDRGQAAERSHVIPDEGMRLPGGGMVGGAFCPCNLVPERGDINNARGNTDMFSTGKHDPRTHWTNVAGMFMTGPKRARRTN